MALRAAKAQCPTSQAELADVSGRIDLSRLRQDAQLNLALQDGLRWRVISRDVERMCPDLPAFVQLALNAEAKESVSEIEVVLQCFRMFSRCPSECVIAFNVYVGLDGNCRICLPGCLHRAAARMLHVHKMIQDAGDKDPNLDDIKRRAGSTNPPCKSWIEDIIKFVMQSPRSGELLFGIRDAKKCFGGPRDSITRSIGSEFLRAVNSMYKGWGPGEAYPIIVHSLVKANMAGDKVVDGVYRSITTSAVTSLRNPKIREQVKQAERFLADARVFASSVAESASIKAISRADVRCAYFLVKKKAPGDKSFESISEIAQASWRAKWV